MATEQISTSIIADDAVTTAKVADDAITGALIENNPTIAGNLTVSGTTTATGAFTASGGIANAGTITAGTVGSSVVFPAGHVIKVGRKQILPLDFGSGSGIPRDNTIPQIGEGNQVIQYDFTPKDTSGSSKLLIQANFWMAERANVTNKFAGALFINDTCVHVQAHGSKEASVDWTTFFMQHYASHSGSAVDIEIRSDGGNEVSVNPQSQSGAGDTNYTGGGSSFGGSVSNSELIVWEITA